jgi:hypothetical protein
MADAKVPQPLDSDPEDVSWALTTASSLQASGDYMEALRWLRKAVTAAVAHDDDSRAIELGRYAADFEEAIASAPTRREAGAVDPSSEARSRDTLQDEAAYDDLDQPTHVDPSRKFNDTGQNSAAPLTQMAGSAPHTPPPPAQRITGNPESEITLVPFTMKAAGIADRAGVEAVKAARAALAKTMPVPVQPSVNSTLVTGEMPSLEDEHTIAMRRPPNIDEISTESVDPERTPSTGGDGTVPSMAPLARWRVALVTSADGEPRVLVLKPGTSAPSGAGVGILLPLSSRDAKIIAAMLEQDQS